MIMNDIDIILAEPDEFDIEIVPIEKMIGEPFKTSFVDKHGLKFGLGDVLQFTAHPRFSMKTGKLLICWDEYNGCFGYKYEHSFNKTIVYPFVSHDEFCEDICNHCELICNVKKDLNLLSFFE